MSSLEPLQGFLLLQRRPQGNGFLLFLASPLCHQPIDLQVLEEIECLSHLFIITRHDHNLHLNIVEDDDPPPMLGFQVRQQNAIIQSSYG